MFLTLEPAPQLSPFVKAYWFVEDLAGEHQGELIRTSPVPLAILSVNLGRPNSQENGELVPNVSLLGLQSRARAWRSGADTCFVMAMLTVPGFARLFPSTGAESADELLDLQAVVGDALTFSLVDSIGDVREPLRVAAAIDEWLIGRLMRMPPRTELLQIAAAHEVLRRGGAVEQAAGMAQVSRRQLHRLFGRHLGIGPQELVAMERLHASLSGVQTGRGDPLQGYSDQAHQIRNWKRHLGVTPGAYAHSSRSALANQFDCGGDGGIAYYL